VSQATLEIEERVEAIRARRRLCKVITVLSAFGDESSDETHQRVFSVAALFGSQQEWDDLEAKWIERTGGVEFHSAECESDKGIFAQNDHRDNQNLYKDLVVLLADSGLLGYGVTMDLISQRQHMPDLPPESAYYKCFGEVVAFFAHRASLIDPKERVKFTFDRRLETQGNATYLYDYMVNLPEWEHHAYVHDEIGFASRKSVGVQAADIWARELMKLLDNEVGPVKRNVRRSFSALEATGRFGATVYKGDYFKGLKKAIDELNETEHPASPKFYLDWLARNKLTDNYQNRVRFYAYQDAIQRATGNSDHFDDVRRLGEK
jgi:hypothetical protein